MEDERKTKKQLIEELKKLRLEQIEQTRVNQEKFTKAFLQNSIPVTITTMKEGRFVDVSNAFLRLVERTRDEVIGHTAIESGFITEEQRVYFLNELKKSGHIEDLETEVRPKGRGLRYGLFNVVMMSYNNENYLLTAIQDITDRKLAEEALRQSEERYRSILESINEGYFELDFAGNYTFVNEANCKFLGYPKEELVGMNYRQHTDEENAKKLYQPYLELYKTGKPIETLEIESIRKDGTKVIYETSVTLIRNPKGKPTGFRGVSRDVTERKRTKEALTKSEEKFRLITENMMDCVALVDTNGTYQYVSPSYKETLGYGPEDMIGIAGFSLTHPDDLERITQLYQEGIKQNWREASAELRIRHKDGHYVSLEVRARAVNDPQGKIIGGILAARDITQRKQMEEELLRARKLESLGVLAGGIAHDFNNLMAIMQGYMELALMDLPPEHVSRQQLLTAMQSVDQTKDLTSRLITFSRGGDPLKETCDVAEIIRDAVHRTVKGTKVKVKFDFMDNLWPIELDKLQMKQCFYNLTTNAVEAMPDGGNLAIQVEKALVPAGEVLDLKEGSYLKITFADEGIGILEEHLSKTFDPYFTTKGMGVKKGMGLGLAVCYSIMKKHGGHITVKSQPGEKGTSFVLYLPAQADQSKERAVKKTVSTGTVRVLIMDDEPHIREIERAYLERMGYEVTDAKDGQEVIDAYKKTLDSGNSFDLVMLDLTVRHGMGGKLAMERLLTIDPSIKAIIVSGFVDDPVIEKYAGYGFLGALKKPFKAKEMKSLLEKVLSE